MKLVYLLILFVVNVNAAPNPPAPTSSPGGVQGAPVTPGVPINDHIIILLIIALSYGLYIVYSRRKASAI